MSYTVTGLKAYTQYTVTVTAINGNGEGHPRRVSILTDEEGYYFCLSKIFFFQIKEICTHILFVFVKNRTCPFDRMNCKRIYHLKIPFGRKFVARETCSNIP